MATRVRLFFLKLLLLLALGAQSSWINADPVVALSNLPPPGNFKPGGSLLNSNGWKAQVFKTPASRVAVKEIKIGLNCGTCGTSSERYPSIADVEINLYSVRNQAGRQMPDTQLYSIPMQRLTLTGRGTTFAFAVPDWELNEDTMYALVLKSTDEKKVKWGNIELNGVDKAPVAQNGFTFIDSPSDTTAMPRDLYLDTVSGSIGAYPSLGDLATPGSYVTTIGMTQTGSSAAPVSSTLTINVVSGVTPSLQLWYPNVTGIAGGGSVSINPTISASTGAVSFSLDGATALPNGLSLNSVTGVISGTPTTATGTVVIPSIRVVDGSGASATAPLQIEILPFTPGLPATLTYPAEVTAYVGFRISIGPTVTNLTGTPAFSVQSPYVWSNSGRSYNNALEIKVLFIPTMSIPTLSEWAQIGMMLMMIGAVAWQTRRVIGRR